MPWRKTTLETSGLGSMEEAYTSTVVNWVARRRHQPINHTLLKALTRSRPSRSIHNNKSGSAPGEKVCFVISHARRRSKESAPPTGCLWAQKSFHWKRIG